MPHMSWASAEGWPMGPEGLEPSWVLRMLSEREGLETCAQRPRDTGPRSTSMGRVRWGRPGPKGHSLACSKIGMPWKQHSTLDDYTGDREKVTFFGKSYTFTWSITSKKKELLQILTIWLNCELHCLSFPSFPFILMNNFIHLCQQYRPLTWCWA